MLFLSLLACGNVKDVHDEHSEGELISRVVLSLTDSAGETVDYTWTDPEQSGTPTVDTVALTNSETYAVSVSFWNDLSDPIEDITPEIVDEAEEHMVVTIHEGLFDVTILIKMPTARIWDWNRNGTFLRSVRVPRRLGFAIYPSRMAIRPNRCHSLMRVLYLANGMYLSTFLCL